MKKAKQTALLLAVALCGALTSCNTVTPAAVSYNEYRAGVVPVSSVGLKDANYKILKRLTATADVSSQSSAYQIIIRVDDEPMYTYSIPGSVPILTSFNSNCVLGAVDGFPTIKDIRNPELNILAQQVALGKILKQLVDLGGDAITYPVVEVVRKQTQAFQNPEYVVTLSAYAVKLNPAK